MDFILEPRRPIDPPVPPAFALHFINEAIPIDPCRDEEAGEVPLMFRTSNGTGSAQAIHG
jgi:hypothetical protein